MWKNVQHNSLQSHLSVSFKNGIYISESRSYSSIVFDVFIEQTLCKLVVRVLNFRTCEEHLSTTVIQASKKLTWAVEFSLDGFL